jgi:hypothetical protein
MCYSLTSTQEHDAVNPCNKEVLFFFIYVVNLGSLSFSPPIGHYTPLISGGKSFSMIIHASHVMRKPYKEDCAQHIFKKLFDELIILMMLCPE